MSLRGRGEVSGEGFEFDGGIVVFDLLLEFLHAVLVVCEEGEVDTMDRHFGPGIVGDNGEYVAFRELSESRKDGVFMFEDSFSGAVFPH